MRFLSNTTCYPMDEINKRALDKVRQGLIGTDHPVRDEAEILEMIEARVSELLRTNPDLLMSYMYRLDVLEYKIKAALDQKSELSVSERLARLIWERQKQRIKTKLQYSRKNTNFWYDDTLD